MIRKATDRRVKLVMAVLARASASPHNIVGNVASMILSHGNRCDEFEMPSWRPESIPPVVLAHLVGCPSSALDAYVEQARKERAWIEWWDREGHAEGNRVERAA